MSKLLRARLPTMLEGYKGVSPIRKDMYSTQRTVTILYQPNLTLRSQGSFGQTCGPDFPAPCVCASDSVKYEKRVIERTLGAEAFKFWNIAE